MKKILALTFALLVAVCACQKVEETDNQFSESSYDSQSVETRASSSFTSQFNINWSEVPNHNASCSYGAIKTMQVTCDKNYLYLLFTANPAKMKTSTSYDYANVLNVYLGNSSDTDSTYWAEKATNVSKMGGWLMKKGKPCFTSWGDGVSSQAVKAGDAYYYEIRYPRSINDHLQRSDVLVGLYMNNRYQVNGTPSSGYSTVGIRPNNESNLYWLSLKKYLGVRDDGGKTLINKSYSEIDEDVPNPERGLYKQIDYVFKNKTLSDIHESDITGFDGSLIFTLFVLNYYQNKDDIHDAIPQIQRVMEAIRKAGKKAIIRFAYTNSDKTSSYDASMKRICTHIEKLKTEVFEKYTDVIYLVQCGFIGAWGEWYYSDHFTKDNCKKHDFNFVDSEGGEHHNYDKSYGKVTEYGNRASVIDALYSAVPYNRQIALRTPHYKRFYLSPNDINTWSKLNRVSTSGPDSRISFHNDAFMIDGGEEMGTFLFDQTMDRTMWKDQSAYLAIGGETGSLDETDPNNKKYVDFKKNLKVEEVVHYIMEYNYSYLHEHPSSYMYKWWVKYNWLPAIKKALGYRLWLEKLTIKGSSLSKNQKVQVYLKIKNSGAAPVINYRPMRLVLLPKGMPADGIVLDPHVMDDSSFGDIREITSGKSMEFIFKVTMPKTLETGDQLAIWMPDADVKHHGLDSKSVYSIHLANDGISFTDKYGYNIIYTHK